MAVAISLIERMATAPISRDDSPLELSLQISPAAAARSTHRSQSRAAAQSQAANDQTQRFAGTLGEHGSHETSLDAVLGSPFPAAASSLKEVTAPKTADPPPLPIPHISRSDTFPSLARELGHCGIATVIGYSKSGKTSLLTEFARGYPGGCAWLSVERPPASGDEWWELTLFQLARHFGVADSAPAIVRDRLLDAAKRQPVLLVVDDAHLLPDLHGMGFLEQAIAASNGRVSVILAGMDESAFVERMRSRGITTWRIPGFNLDECSALFQSSIGPLSSSQQAALAALRERTDGHPGIVSLCRENIRQIKTSEDVQAFTASFEGGLGIGPDAFHAALFRTFQSGLAEEELSCAADWRLLFMGSPDGWRNRCGNTVS